MNLKGRPCEACDESPLEATRKIDGWELCEDCYQDYIPSKEVYALVACEESQRVTIALRKRGIIAFSCDILDCSGGHPEWHIKDDVLNWLGKNKYNEFKGWDLMIAHPPCHKISKAGARWLYQGGEINQKRLAQGMKAKDFFMTLLNAPIPRIAVENPTPLKIFGLPKHSQVIQPWQFGHPYSKRTLLWLKGLPMLITTSEIKDYTPYLPSNTGGKKRGQKSVIHGVVRDPRICSKTFTGIAEAMADQWGSFVIEQIRKEVKVPIPPTDKSVGILGTFL